ncbi:MAG: MFS transporter [Verrucomicrobia bacterium]|nr:MFS transporter [Verrucomicrobiota bacterium]
MTPKPFQDLSPTGTDGAGQTPTHARQWVLMFAVTLAIVTYIDRVCISKTASLIMADLNLSKEQMGLAFSAFAWAYALFEIPGGWLGDKIGPRKVLMRIVVMWSIFTALTGVAWGLVSLVLFRFFFGMGEAGCFPNLTKAFTIWFPATERVRAQGIMWLSARWGGAFTPLLVVWVLGFVSWRSAFWLFGLLGVVWAIFFYRWFRDNPAQHPSVNAAELSVIGDSSQNAVAHGAVPWGRFLSNRTVWLLWAQYFCMSYGWYFYITWMPTYIKESFGHLSEMEQALLNCIPLFFGGLGSFFIGMISAPVARLIGSTLVTRRAMGFIGLTGAAAMLLISIQFKNPLLAMLSVGMASFCNDLAMPGAWGACMDVGGKYAGSLSGSMNMMGNFGGAVAPMVVAYVLQHFNNNWNLNFQMFAAVYFVGAICWLFIDPVTPLDHEEEPVRS